MNLHIAQNFNISVGAELIEKKLVGCWSSSKGDDAWRLMIKVQTLW